MGRIFLGSDENASLALLVIMVTRMLLTRKPDCSASLCSRASQHFPTDITDYSRSSHPSPQFLKYVSGRGTLHSGG
ncbi:hypothetical protein NC652_006282 [Populus alba x Populus x berolinensis]|nr:hypothetical protein NC652_006282 [Populus alba x Populus x berolinensis]